MSDATPEAFTSEQESEEQLSTLRLQNQQLQQELEERKSEITALKERIAELDAPIKHETVPVVTKADYKPNEWVEVLDKNMNWVPGTVIEKNAGGFIEVHTERGPLFLYPARIRTPQA